MLLLKTDIKFYSIKIKIIIITRSNVALKLNIKPVFVLESKKLATIYLLPYLFSST